MLENSQILRNRLIKGSYYQIDLCAPQIAEKAGPGQFVHIKINGLRDRILRRPFSIFKTGTDGTVSIVYKVVGQGTDMLSGLQPGTVCSLMGPLGKGFSIPGDYRTPVIAVGGYGCAATYILARRSGPGILLMGARNSDELILTDEFEKIGFDVRVSTDDGSAGKKGFVTTLLEDFIELNSGDLGKYRFYACGPIPMLARTGKIILSHGIDAEISLDRHMCCGLGACFACVHKIKDEKSPDGWRYARICMEGPVFKASEVLFD